MGKDIAAILIGCTQQGKSTFINCVCRAGAEVGNGSESVTTNTASYISKFPEKQCGFYFEKNDTKVVVTGDMYDESNVEQLKILQAAASSSLMLPGRTTHVEEFLYENQKSRITYFQHVIGEYNVKLLDTPGLDDTNRQDNLNVENILDTIISENISTVNAMIFVIKCDQAYTGSFQDKYNYYLKLFPGLSKNIVILRTCFDDRLRIKNYKKNNGYKEEKIQGFNNKFFESTQISPTQVFMDLVPYDFNDEYEENISSYKKYVYELELQHFVKHLSEMPPCDFNKLLYYKLDNIKNIDKLVCERIKGVINNNMRDVINITLSYKSMEDSEKENLNKINKIIQEKQEEFAKLETTILGKDITEKEVNIGHIIIKDDVYTGFERFKKFVDREVKIVIFQNEACRTETIYTQEKGKLEINFNSKSIIARHPISECRRNNKWTERLSECKYSATITPSSMFSSKVGGRVDFYSYYKDYYNNEINQCKKEQKHITDIILLNTEKRGETTGKLTNVDDRKKKDVEDKEKINEIYNKILPLIECEYIELKTYYQLKHMYNESNIDGIISWYINNESNIE